MAMSRKKPCRICRRRFQPNPRVGSRQRACSRAECQAARRRKTQARWRKRNAGYIIEHRIRKRGALEPQPDPPRLPPPLSKLPWQFAKDQFGAELTHFLGVTSRLLLQAAKDQIRSDLIDFKGVPDPLPTLAAKDQIRPDSP